MCWTFEGFQFFWSPSKTNLIVSCNLTFFTMVQKELSDNSLKRPESTWATNSSPLPKFCTGYKFHSNNQQKVNIEILWISMNRVCKNSLFYINCQIFYLNQNNKHFKCIINRCCTIPIYEALWNILPIYRLH